MWLLSRCVWSRIQSRTNMTTYTVSREKGSERDAPLFTHTPRNERYWTVQRRYSPSQSHFNSNHGVRVGVWGGDHEISLLPSRCVVFSVFDRVNTSVFASPALWSPSSLGSLHSFLWKKGMYTVTVQTSRENLPRCLQQRQCLLLLLCPVTVLLPSWFFEVSSDIGCVFLVSWHGCDDLEWFKWGVKRKAHLLWSQTVNCELESRFRMWNQSPHYASAYLMKITRMLIMHAHYQWFNQNPHYKFWF